MRQIKRLLARGGSGGKAGGGSGEAGGRAEVDGRSHVRAAGAEGPSPLVDRDQQHLQKCQKSVHCQDLEAPQMGADDDRVEYVPSPAFPAGRRRRPVSAIRGEELISHTRFEDGVRYMEFTEAVWKSMQGEGAVQLPLL